MVPNACLVEWVGLRRLVCSHDGMFNAMQIPWRDKHSVTLEMFVIYSKMENPLASKPWFLLLFFFFAF